MHRENLVVRMTHLRLLKKSLDGSCRSETAEEATEVQT